jgi:hypothetical protein
VEEILEKYFDEKVRNYDREDGHWSSLDAIKT